MIKAVPVILIYVFLYFIELSELKRKKQKKQMIVFFLTMLIPLVLSISIVIGVNMPTISSITRKLIPPIIKQN
ncbi:hypothetical protein JK636_11830 [Clostridium sp. YIM B02515]|uniref:Uncharacterized protein n=1 Tax=Clostridium rhizosphaerae TaxID=2803861 RepID=A0ABS1TAS3_9CLOT|nr:hypothetical protein [Clostridium rhizosphaerae]MBL4936449.1 hypothetical protein [Clostridium rhizosphaerae]